MRWSRGSVRLPALLVLVLLLLGEQVLLGGPAVRLDTAVETALVPHRDNALVAVARILTELGDPALVVPLLLVGVVLLPRRGAALRHVVVLVAVLAAAVLGLKAGVGRPAAHGAAAHGGSWPSGHTTTAVVVWGTAARLLLRRPAAVLAARWVVPPVVGVSLVLAGYHQVSDVLAGFALGALLLVLARVLDPPADRGQEPADGPGQSPALLGRA